MTRGVVYAFIVLLLIIWIPAESVLFQPAQASRDLITAGFPMRPTVHLSHNAFFNWPDDQAEDVWPVVHQAGKHGAASWLLFCSGMAALFNLALGGSPFLMPLLLALSLTAGVAGAFGFDAALLGTIAVYPWLAVGLCRIRRGLWPVALLAVLSLLNILYANQLAFISGLAALFTAGALGSERRVRGALIVLLPAVLVWILVPGLPSLGYPAAAHVVPDDGLPGIIRPLIGPDSEIPFIDRPWIKQAYAGAAWLLGLVWLSATALIWRSAGKGARTLLLAGGIVGAGLVVDTALPESWSSIGPLAALSRIVPFAFFIPLAPLAAVFGFTLTVIGTLHAEGRKTALVALAIVVGAIVVPQRRTPVLQRANAQAPIQGLTQEQLALIRDQAISPSYGLLRAEGWSVLASENRKRPAIFRPIGGDHVVITGPQEIGSKKVGRLVDLKPGSRWSMGGGRQTGHEWLHLAFPEMVRVGGIELATGKFATDFPRGLRISGSETCGQAEPEFMQYREIVSYPEWPGELLFTPSGLPYYGSQSQVKVLFADEVSVRCLWIQQTGQSKNFDWSVAEIALTP